MAIPYNSNYDETLPFSDVCAQFTLTTNNAQSWTIPGTELDKYSARFEYAANANIFICKNSAPVIPGNGSMGTQQYNEFRPGPQRYVQGGDVLYFTSPDAVTYVGISLRQLQG